MDQSVFFCCLTLLNTASGQPVPQGAVTGISTSIACELGRQVDAPFWFINGTVYELFSIPQYFPSIPVVSSYTSLFIPIVTFMVNNVVFRCATFQQNGNLGFSDSATRLIVQGNNLELSEQNFSNLQLNYQRLHIQMDKTTIGWTFKNICNERFELQGFIITNGQAVRSSAHDFTVNNSDMTEILTSQLFRESSNSIYYRLVAVWENRTVCSDRTSQDTYYRLKESAILETVISTPRSRLICFELPSTETCDASLYFIWPQREEGLSCLCPVYNSDDGRLVLTSCIRGCNNSSIMPHLSSGQIYISNLSASMSGTLFHFMCSTDPCTGNCFVKTILRSYRVLYSDEELRLVGPNPQIDIPCDISTGLAFPYWLVNDTLYTITSLLQSYPLFSLGVNNTLSIVVTEDSQINNTIFQCVAAGGNEGISLRIIYSDHIELENELCGNTSITFNSQELEVTNTSVRTGWIVSKQFDYNQCPSFEVQQISANITSSNLTSSKVLAKTNLTNAVINSSELVEHYYRIVGISDGNICSDNDSTIELYNVTGSSLGTIIKKPNSMVCLELLKAKTRCENATVEVAFKNCICSTIRENYCHSCVNNTISVYLNNSVACFMDKNSSLNGLQVHLVYVCPPHTCCRDIRINTIVKSYTIIISDEERPSQLYITYTISSLCFHVDANVTLNYTISTFENPERPIMNQLFGPDCIDDPYPDTCTEFNVTAFAINLAGTSLSVTKNFTSQACESQESPSKLEIVYNSSSLCFGAQSSIEVTFEYVISTDGEPTTGMLTGLNPCVDDPFPTTCNTFNVTLVATNGIESAPPYVKSNIISNGCQNQATDQRDNRLAIVLGIPFGVIIAVISAVILAAIMVSLCKYRKWKTYTLRTHSQIQLKRHETS